MTKQISAADRIVVTKGDRMTPEARDALVHGLAVMNPAATVVDVHDGDWDAAWLMVEAAGISSAQVPAEAGDDHAGHAHHRRDPKTHMAAWPDGPRTSRLVFIVDGIEEARIRASFEVFAGLR
jgi:G3E family GTPase